MKDKTLASTNKGVYDQLEDRSDLILDIFASLNDEKNLTITGKETLESDSDAVIPMYFSASAINLTTHIWLTAKNTKDVQVVAILSRSVLECMAIRKL
jgi:hypothetical protein